MYNERNAYNLDRNNIVLGYLVFSAKSASKFLPKPRHKEYKCLREQVIYTQEFVAFFGRVKEKLKVRTLETCHRRSINSQSNL